MQQYMRARTRLGAQMVKWARYGSERAPPICAPPNEAIAGQVGHSDVIEALEMTLVFLRFTFAFVCPSQHNMHYSAKLCLLFVVIFLSLREVVIAESSGYVRTIQFHIIFLMKIFCYLIICVNSSLTLSV